MFPLGPEGEGGPEPDIIGTAGEGRSRWQDRGRPHWWWYVVAAGVFALAGVITVVSMPSSQRHAAAPHPSGVTGGPAQPRPPAPGAVPTQAWPASLSIANWPMPGSGTGIPGGMFAGGVAGSGAAGNGGWELTARDVTQPGQRCTAAVVLYLYGTITNAYPISTHPALCQFGTFSRAAKHGRCAPGGDRKGVSHRLGRTFPLLEPGRDGPCAPRASPQSPQLVHGTEGDHQFGDTHEQGARTHRGASSLRPWSRSARRLDPSPVDRALPRVLSRRRGARAAELPRHAHPHRLQPRLARAHACSETERLDLAKLGALSFELPDEARFPALRVAKAALAAGGGATTVLNAANEVAVEAFFADRIAFLAIASLVEATLEAAADLAAARPSGVEEVLAVDAEARARAALLLPRFANL